MQRRMFFREKSVSVSQTCHIDSIPRQGQNGSEKMFAMIELKCEFSFPQITGYVPKGFDYYKPLFKVNPVAGSKSSIMTTAALSVCPNATKHAGLKRIPLAQRSLGSQTYY